MQLIWKYSLKHDIMHIFISSGPYFYEEEYPGIYVACNENTNEIEKFTIMDWSKNKKLFEEKFPEYAENKNLERN